MAYLAFDSIGHVGAGVGARTAPVAPRLTELERQVVAIASKEPLSSLHTRWRPLLDVVFGTTTHRPLADPRLEAIRRLVVLQRHGHRGTAQAAAEAIALGVAPTIVHQLQREVAPRAPYRSGSIIVLFAIVTLLALTVSLLVDYFGEVLPATVVGLTLSLPVATGACRIAGPRYPRLA